MNSRLSFLAAALLSISLSAPAGAVDAVDIAPGGTYNQNFDSIGKSATASLPSGWSTTSSASARSVTATEWAAADTLTEKQGTGTGTNAGIYNWGDAGDTSDRGVGFLASGSAAKTGNLYLSLTATGYIPSFTVSYDMKCYRNNTRQFQFQLHYSTDAGATWTSAGNNFLTTYAVATNGVVVDPAGVASVSSKTLNVSLASGETVILCWSYSVPSGSTTSNAQGLGIDNVSIVAGASSGPAPLATPPGLSVVSVTNSGFSLSWTAVEDAADYEVEVLAGSAPAGTVSVSGTGATVTGLSADTDYTAKVRALPPAGSTTLLASDWSVPIDVTTELAGGLKWGPVFKEEFSGTSTTYAWNGAQFLSGEGDVDAARTDMDTWHGKDLYNAPAALRFGNTSKHGWVTSPAVSLSNDVSSATVKVTFSAGALAAAAANRMVFSVLDASGDTIEIAGVSPVTLLLPVLSPSGTLAEALAASNALPQSLSFTAPAGFKMKFDASQGSANSNIAIDDVLVRQMVDPNFAVLPAPTGLDTNVVDKTWFSVSWNTVTNATNYEVEVFDESSVPAGTVDVSGTNATVSGLSDGTTYSVQVRALGDGLHYGDSQPSAAISVTTLADAQKIDFTVAGAPAGDVYAGDSVSFTVTATNEATHAAEPVSFAGGLAGATFANGIFSWTPTESDVGSHTAVFSSGDYSTNVAITVLSASVSTNLFHETFANCATEWKNRAEMPVNGASSKETFVDEADWSFTDCYRGMSGLRMGLEGKFGTATTREIDPVAPGTVSLSFRAAAYSNQLGSLTVTATGGANFSQTVSLVSLTNTAAAIPDTAGYEFGPYDIVATGGFTLAFTPASGDGRMGVDEILVSQIVSAKLRGLAAPAGLAIVAGSVATNGFTVSWSPVQDATNYAVRVLDASGAIAFSAPFCAEPPVAVEGLLDDEDYAVQVRATGDETLFFASAWSAPLAVRTERSPLHPTLSFGPWTNAAEDGKVHGGIVNTATVSALRDNESNAVVTLVSVSPVPDAGPTLSDGVLSWTPADADTNKTFTLRFLMDGTYATNLAFHVFSVPALEPPVVTVGEVAWNAIPLSWDAQMRAARYGVRVWTDCPNPGATSSRVEENFANWIPYSKTRQDARPIGWTFNIKNTEPFYSDEDAPVKLGENGNSMQTYDLGGLVSSVSFHAAGHSMGETSELSVIGIAADGTETFLGSVSGLGLGNKTTGADFTFYVPDNKEVRRVAWRYSKAGGGVGVGSVVIEGEGFTTPRWLPGWGSAAKDVGLAQDCTVEKPRPGRVLGVDPSDPREDLIDPRVHYAEVRAVDASGNWLATIVEAPVPAPPRSVRATMMILK